MPTSIQSGSNGDYLKGGDQALRYGMERTTRQMLLSSYSRMRFDQERVLSLRPLSQCSMTQLPAANSLIGVSAAVLLASHWTKLPIFPLGGALFRVILLGLAEKSPLA